MQGIDFARFHPKLPPSLSYQSRAHVSPVRIRLKHGRVAHRLPGLPTGDEPATPAGIMADAAGPAARDRLCRGWLPAGIRPRGVI
jgi:hypothetical protein